MHGRNANSGSGYKKGTKLRTLPPEKTVARELPVTAIGIGGHWPIKNRTREPVSMPGVGRFVEFALAPISPSARLQRQSTISQYAGPPGLMGRFRGDKSTAPCLICVHHELALSESRQPD
jgi:hypothetical protein